MEGPTLNIVNDEIFSSWQWLVPKGRNCLQLYRVIWGTRLLSIISKENWIFNMEIVSRKLRISTLKSNRQKRIYSKPLAFYTKEICCWLLVENAKTSIGQKKMYLYLWPTLVETLVEPDSKPAIAWPDNQVGRGPSDNVVVLPRPWVHLRRDHYFAASLCAITLLNKSKGGVGLH